MTEVTRQRIEHLKLQGFTPEQASKMQDVEEREVRLVYQLGQDSIVPCDAPFNNRIKDENSFPS